MEVVLIRHTRVDVPKGTCYGQTDVPVAATFEIEAEATRLALADYQPFDCVYSSPLTRARRLASYCGYDHPLTDRRLMEMSMGQWEMQRYDDISDPYLQQWYDDYMHLPTPG
ncbi:MAG: histidine phosphatase family protein, partial [Prevotella sp.]|nr:histidine phosphatase family protein [Prevotella sp.]